MWWGGQILQSQKTSMECEYHTIIGQWSLSTLFFFIPKTQPKYIVQNKIAMPHFRTDRIEYMHFDIFTATEGRIQVNLQTPADVRRQ